MFRGDLFVTIAEIYILDVCACLHKIFFLVIYFHLIVWISLKRLKMECSKMMCC